LKKVYLHCFEKLIKVFANADPNEMLHEGHFWALMFLALGIVQGFTSFFQAFLFDVAAGKLTMRLRSKLFRHILRMDIAYFDDPKHSSGKICTRLATDVPNLKSVFLYQNSNFFIISQSIIDSA
jgi:ATP-binding cassette, subfamily B (MDR/TAP), member 1